MGNQTKEGFRESPRDSQILHPGSGLTFSVPRDQTVNGIVDIMAHVFEQYFSLTPDTALQDRLAESILQTMVEIGPVLLKNLDNYEARAEMLWCGTMALNSLIAKGKTEDWATHMMEHEVSAIYDIPHGAGLSIIFPNWMKYMLDTGTGKFAQYAARVGGLRRKEKAKRMWPLRVSLKQGSSLTR